jgi:hypothetical protein
MDKNLLSEIPTEQLEQNKERLELTVHELEIMLEDLEEEHNELISTNIMLNDTIY